MIAPCHFGLEAVLKKEIIDLGYDVSKVEDGRVTFVGDEEAVCRMNVFSRTAERILIKVGSFMATTFDELFETLSLRQLGIHNKPIAVFNIDGYFDPLGQMLKNAYDGNFMTKEILELCPLFNNETDLLKYLEENANGTGDFSVLKALK